MRYAALSHCLLLFIVAYATAVDAFPTLRSHRIRAASRRAHPTSQLNRGFFPSTAAGSAGTEEEVVRRAVKSSSSLSPTSSASEAEPSSISSPKNILAALFPLGTNGSTWSTSPEAPHPLPLSDSTLRPHNILSALSHDVVSAPDGKKGMKAHFPKGSFAFVSKPLGGMSFYAPGPKNVDITTAKEATFGYSLYFDEGFQFNRGGKLPGMYGGDTEDKAMGCSGGRRDTACFSARLMWRKDGQGELYTYLPPDLKGNKNVCNVKPLSICNDEFGASVGRNSFKWKAGQWNAISQRVKLNDIGSANGELELFVEGESVINVKGLTLRDSAQGKIRGIQMQTFFGGHTEEWASPKNQNIYFSDFSFAILDTL